MHEGPFSLVEAQVCRGVEVSSLGFSLQERGEKDRCVWQIALSDLPMVNKHTAQHQQVAGPKYMMQLNECLCIITWQPASIQAFGRTKEG